MAAADFVTEAQLQAAIDAISAAVNTKAPKTSVAFINVHGAVASTARNNDYAINLWVGSVAPANITGNDFVIRTDEAVA